MNLRWTLRRTSPAAAIVLLAGGLFLVSASQAPETQEAAFDIPTMAFLPMNVPTTAAPTTTTTEAPTTTTTTAPIVYDPVPPGGRQNIGGDKHPMEAHPAFGMIVIPKINLVHPVFEGIDETAIHWGPGHWPGSAMPGRAGNAVFAGHRVTNDHPFRRIDELTPGDEVIFHVSGVRSVYRVTNSMVVEPEDTWIANQTQRPTATLYACHPPGSAVNRYVVQLALVSTGPEA